MKVIQVDHNEQVVLVVRLFELGSGGYKFAQDSKVFLIKIVSHKEKNSYQVSLETLELSWNVSQTSNVVKDK